MLGSPICLTLIEDPVARFFAVPEADFFIENETRPLILD